MLAYPTDDRSLDFISHLGAEKNSLELWVGLDNNSLEPWTSSTGNIPATPIRWNGTGPLEDDDKQYAFIDHGSGG
jgi:hypothetical protein